MIKRWLVSFKEWWKSLGAKIKKGINRLYKQPWFNLLYVLFVCGFSFAEGAIGISLAFIYFIGWVTMADKTITSDEKGIG